MDIGFATDQKDKSIIIYLSHPLAPDLSYPVLAIKGEKIFEFKELYEQCIKDLDLRKCPRI
jgi:hypothetical protein